MQTITRSALMLQFLPLAVLFGSPDAAAWPSCGTIFATTYPSSQSDDLGGCQTCHQLAGGGGNYNTYGSDLLANGATGAGANCTSVDFQAAMLTVEGLDSDSEGSSNIVEIQADTQPGWCDTRNVGCMNSAGTPPNVPLDPPPPVGNTPPVANAGGPYSGEAGITLIQFDGSASSDADGDALTYAWDFGDGSNAAGMMPTHTYTAAGNFQVTLIVNDGQANSTPSMAAAAISAPPVNLAPIADPGGPYTGQTGQAVAFDGSGSSDPNNDPLTFAWDFGDGSQSSDAAPMHAYAVAGMYTVTLTVSDGQADSMAATTTATITTPLAGGAALYAANCLGCHGDPWDGPAVDSALPGLRRVAGARSCNLQGSIFGTSVFPNGVPEMQFLQNLTGADIDALADYLNSQPTSGEQRYITTCAGCHGNDGTGGRVGEAVLGESAGETREAIREDQEMRYLSCMPSSDIDAIATFLRASDNDINDDDSDSGGGSTGVPLLLLTLFAALVRWKAMYVTKGRR